LEKQGLALTLRIGLRVWGIGLRVWRTFMVWGLGLMV
jgi:hypothetical protein